LQDTSWVLRYNCW